MTNDQKVIVGFLCGVAAGALAGILLAPNSGEETRKIIADKATDLKDDLSNQLSSTFGRLSEQVNNSLGLKKNNNIVDAATRKLASETVDA
ncbi:MAG TPA: YtxH domain-containing protein [Catalimonadaceae bacterium]|nr:YtxH domain-containing protein [Catalimonadaceae bacterium]HPI10462.1 YtxH domain-containing protein [Catalimonadaceae bacterium]